METNEPLQLRIAEAIRDGVYHSAQVDGVVIHGAIDSIMQIIEAESKHWQEKVANKTKIIDEAFAQLKSIGNLEAEVERLTKENGELRETLKASEDVLYFLSADTVQASNARDEIVNKINQLLNSGTESRKE